MAVVFAMVLVHKTLPVRESNSSCPLVNDKKKDGQHQSGGHLQLRLMVEVNDIAERCFDITFKNKLTVTVSETGENLLRDWARD